MFSAEANSATTFDGFAETGGYEVKNAIRVGKNDKRLGGLQNARNIVFWLFNDASNGEVSDVFELNESYVVAVQTREQEDGTARLVDVRNGVSRKVLDEKKAESIISKLSSLSGSYEEISEAYGEGGRTGSGNLTFSSNSFPNIGFAPEAIGVAFSLEEGESTLPFKTQNGIIMLTVSVKTPLTELDDYEAYRGVVINAQRDFRRREEPFTYQNIYEALTKSADIEDNRYKFY
jgi:peptidyl-prolyl cis-trans isomerase D